MIPTSWQRCIRLKIPHLGEKVKGLESRLGEVKTKL